MSAVNKVVPKLIAENYEGETPICIYSFRSAKDTSRDAVFWYFNVGEDSDENNALDPADLSDVEKGHILERYEHGSVISYFLPYIFAPKALSETLRNFPSFCCENPTLLATDERALSLLRNSSLIAQRFALSASDASTFDRVISQKGWVVRSASEVDVPALVERVSSFTDNVLALQESFTENLRAVREAPGFIDNLEELVTYYTEETTSLQKQAKALGNKMTKYIASLTSTIDPLVNQWELAQIALSRIRPGRLLVFNTANAQPDFKKAVNLRLELEQLAKIHPIISVVSTSEDGETLSIECAGGATIHVRNDGVSVEGPPAVLQQLLHTKRIQVAATRKGPVLARTLVGVVNKTVDNE